MSTSFSRTMRSLESDNFRSWFVGLFLVVLALLAWGYWLIFSEITLYEISPVARLEVDRGVHPIEALVEGRVVRTELALGREVKAGEVLVEIDSSAQKLQLKEEEERLASLTPALEALRGEVKAIERGRISEKKGGKAALEEAKARYREAETAARLAESELERQKILLEKGAISETEYQRAKAEAEKSRAAADTLRFAINRQRWDQETSGSGQEADIERLKGEVARLEGEIASKKATIERLKNEIEKCVIKAPIAGKLGQVSGLRVGAVVRQGEQLAALIPEGELKAVAEFPPQSAVGKIKPGQPAQLKLDGFPWTEYGVVPATVESVANETREGMVKVELSIQPLPGSLIPLQHGLQGTVEVEVERVSPAALILRTTGQKLSEASTSGGAKP